MTSIFDWIYERVTYIKDAHNPYTEIGRKRYEIAIERFKKLIKHDWLSNFLQNKKFVKILDLCGGSGIGGIAFCKILQDLGIECSLTIQDIRDKALEIAKKFSFEELGKEVEIIKKDVREFVKLDQKFDIVLMYGASTIYFNPWDFIRILVYITENLYDHGIFINDDVDRVYTIMYEEGYEDVIVEDFSEKKLIISIHDTYDFNKGVFKRRFYDILNNEYGGVLELHMWTISNIAAYTWIFFKDVDIYRDEISKPWQMFIIAKEPRRNISPIEFLENPKLLRKI